MGISWYKKSMPKIKNIKPNINKMASAILSINGVKSVLAWGSYVENQNKPNFIIKDIDLIAVCDFYSEDLLSITEDKNNSPFKINEKDFENLGFDKNAVKFTEKFISLEKYNIDPWAISNDDKLLHWGAISPDKEEWDEIKKEAEEYTDFLIGVERKELHKFSQKIKDKWKLSFDHYIFKFISDMPRGWYQSEHHISEILPNTIKII